MTRKWAPPTLYKLRCNTASMVKDLIRQFVLPYPDLQRLIFESKDLVNDETEYSVFNVFVCGVKLRFV